MLVDYKYRWLKLSYMATLITYTFGDFWAILGTFGRPKAPKSGFWAGFGHCPAQNPFGRPKCQPCSYLFTWHLT